MGEWPRMASPIGLKSVSREYGPRVLAQQVTGACWSRSLAHGYTCGFKRDCAVTSGMLGVVRDGESGRACIYVTISSRRNKSFRENVNDRSASGVALVRASGFRHDTERCARRRA